MASIKEELDYPKIWTSNNSKQLSYSKKRRKFDESITWGRSSKDFNDFFESLLVGNVNNEGGEIYLYKLTDHIHYSPVSSKPHITITLNDNSKIRYYFNNLSKPIQIDKFGYAKNLQGQIGIVIKLNSIFEKIITSSNFKRMAEIYIDTAEGKKTKGKKRKRNKTKHKKRKQNKTKHKKRKHTK